MIKDTNVSLSYAKDSKERMPWEHYLKEFKGADPSVISNRLGIFYDIESQTFEFYFMGSTYYIHYPDFKVTHKNDDRLCYPLEDSQYAKILITRYLLEACPTSFKGQFLSYRDIPWGEVYYRQFYGRCIGRLSRKYGNKIDLFENVMEKLEAKKVEYGDIAYDLEFMKDLYIRFIIWQGDDEFSPSAQILFSDNFSSSFTAEDLAYVGDICMNTFAIVEKSIK